MGNWRQSIGLSAALLGVMPTLCLGGAGTSTGNILDMGVGARAIGMGEAYTAQADDVSSLYWNPAGLALMNQSQASFIYNPAIQGISFNNASVGVPFEYGGMGASLSYLSFGAITGYDTSGNLNGSVSANSTVGTLGGAWYGGPLSAGANIKIVQASLADVKATGAAFDAGASWTCQTELLGGTLRVASVIRNLGSGLTFINETDPFPTEWRLGTALVQMANTKLNVSMDIAKQRDLSIAPYLGAEYWLIPQLALRAGYAGSDQAGGMRAGIGLRVKDVSFDYAYAGMGELGFTNRFELSIRFGPLLPRLSAEERKLYRQARRALALHRFEEATLLFDSLVKLEPLYRPFRPKLRLAVTGALRADDYARAHPDAGRVNLLGKGGLPKDDGIDTADLEKLLLLGDDAPDTLGATAQAQAGGARHSEASR